MVTQNGNHLLLYSVLTVAAFVMCCADLSAQNGDGYDADDLLNMSLEELMDMPVDVSGSLTGSSRRLNPSTVTTLTQEDIRRSGARDLDELLDIYIPNFQRMNEYWETRKSGLRGINSDRDDKYLILVNGRVMNEHTRFGALSERDLPMMSDIDHVDVIRGPGSALYGPGGLAMVINIVTLSAETFEGTQVNTRIGAIEEFYTGEVKHGKKTGDDSGYFLYAGISKYLGSDEGESQMDYGWEGILRGAGWPLDDHQPRMNQAYRNMPKSKLHAQYHKGNFEAWVRYTRGGEYTSTIGFMPTTYRYQSQGYQQLTINTNYLQEVCDTFSVDYRLSYDIFDNEKSYFDSVYSHREDEYTGRVLARWAPNDSHSVAFGGEMSYEQFGLKSPGYPGKDPRELFFTFQGIDEMPRWSTTLYSGLAEYQWKMSDEWTTFLGGRIDHHPYVPNMYSPRATLVYTPTDDDTVKLIYSRAARANLAADMKITRMVLDEDSDPDKLDAYELRYERQQNRYLWLGGGSLVRHGKDARHLLPRLHQDARLPAGRHELRHPHRRALRFRRRSDELEQSPDQAHPAPGAVRQLPGRRQRAHLLGMARIRRLHAVAGRYLWHAARRPGPVWTVLLPESRHRVRVERRLPRAPRRPRPARILRRGQQQPSFRF